MSSSSDITGRNQPYKNPPKQKSPIKKHKAGRPSKPKITDRKQLEAYIMAAFGPNWESVRPSVDDPTTEDCMERAERDYFGNESKPDLKEIREKLKKFRADIGDQEFQEKRSDALRKLVFFKDEQTLTRDAFLQRLLPETRKQERLALALEALGKLPVFLDRFVQGGKGWPSKHLADLIGETAPKDKGLDELLPSTFGEEISFHRALLLAPFILSWRDIRNSFEMRGSRSQKTQRKSSPTPTSPD